MQTVLPLLLLVRLPYPQILQTVLPLPLLACLPYPQIIDMEARRVEREPPQPEVSRKEAVCRKWKLQSTAPPRSSGTQAFLNY